MKFFLDISKSPPAHMAYSLCRLPYRWATALKTSSPPGIEAGTAGTLGFSYPFHLGY